MEKTIRQRVGVSTSVKGIKTYDCTVEITGDDSDGYSDEILEKIDWLVMQLNKRYPPVQEK